MGRPDASALLALCATLILAAAPAPQPSGVSPAPSATTVPPDFTLAGVAIGRTVLAVVQQLGPPDVVRTTDIGHEWQWVDAGGLDREVLTDDAMIVRQALVAEPAPVPGETPAVVQPPEFPALRLRVVEGNAAIEAAGGQSIAEPDSTVRAWSLPGGVLVAELESGIVGQLLALDDYSARHLGYLMPPPVATPPFIRRAPVMTQEYYAPYPDDAVRAGIEGSVVVRVVIGPDGKPEQTDVVVSSHDRDLDAAAVESVKRSSYRPAQCDGSPCRGVYFDLESYSVFK